MARCFFPHPTLTLLAVDCLNITKLIHKGFSNRVISTSFGHVKNRRSDNANASGASRFRRYRVMLILIWRGLCTWLGSRQDRNLDCVQSYSEERGHPRLRMRHASFVIGEQECAAWVQAMLAAMDEARIPEPAYTTMKDYFEKGASFMMNATPFGGMLRESQTG
jgi:hypothetical protein